MLRPIEARNQVIDPGQALLGDLELLIIPVDPAHLGDLLQGPAESLHDIDADERLVRE